MEYEYQLNCQQHILLEENANKLVVTNSQLATLMSLWFDHRNEDAGEIEMLYKEINKCYL